MVRIEDHLLGLPRHLEPNLVVRLIDGDQTLLGLSTAVLDPYRNEHSKGLGNILLSDPQDNLEAAFGDRGAVGTPAVGGDPRLPDPLVEEPAPLPGHRALDHRLEVSRSRVAVAVSPHELAEDLDEGILAPRLDPDHLTQGVEGQSGPAV